MGKTTIHNLDQLEKEVYRLKLKSKLLEEKMNDHLDYFQQHAGGLFFNSIFQRRNSSGETTPGIVQMLLGHDGLHSAIQRLVGHYADKAAEGLDHLIEKLIHTQKD